jgi:hypothetical protein
MDRKYQEKRREPRKPASGQVKLHVSDSALLALLGRPVIEGEMLDESAHGFRAAHRERELTTGEEVRFESDGTIGRAKVVWNRIVEDRVESGFLKL